MSAELAAALAEDDERDREEGPLSPARSLLGLPEGIHPDVPESTYHARVLGVASKSALDLVHRSPAHYFAWVNGYEKPSTRAFSLGRAVHSAMLEPEKFARTYLIAPDFGDLRATEGRTTKEQGKANKERRAAWLEEHADATILDSADGIATLGMVMAVAAHPLARKLLEGGSSEVTLRWTDPETGLFAKGRVDFDRDDLETSVDLKSCMDARSHASRRSIEQYAYHAQDAMYREGYEILGRPRRNFVFIFVEKEPPHGIRIYSLKPEARAAGARRIRQTMRTLAECVATGVFQAYEETIEELDLSPWALDA